VQAFGYEQCVEFDDHGQAGVGEEPFAEQQRVQVGAVYIWPGRKVLP
jgi:hypothetical protein